MCTHFLRTAKRLLMCEGENKEEEVRKTFESTLRDKCGSSFNLKYSVKCVCKNKNKMVNFYLEFKNYKSLLSCQYM